METWREKLFSLHLMCALEDRDAAQRESLRMVGGTVLYRQFTSLNTGLAAAVDP